MRDIFHTLSVRFFRLFSDGAHASAPSDGMGGDSGKIMAVY